MPKLDSEARDDLSDESFALPNRRYPIPDESHARNALARISQFGSEEEKAKVRAAVKRKFPNIDVEGKTAADATNTGANMPEPTVAADAGAGFSKLKMGNDEVSVHKPSGSMSKEDAKKVPVGSMIKHIGGPNGEMKFHVKAHEKQPGGDNVEPKLEQVGGQPLTPSGTQPHLGHLAQHDSYAKGMGYSTDCSVGTTTGMSACTPAFILQLDDADISEVAPGNLPTKNDAGEPIYYRKMAIAKVGNWKHRGTGNDLVITPKRADEWVQNTTALNAAGVQPFIPGIHDFKYDFKNPIPAKHNYGFIKSVEHDGQKVYAVVALHGLEALKIAAKNGRSVGVVSNAIDEKGKQYFGESIHHLALRPNPALSDLGGMAKIAASADGATMEIPVYTMPSASTPATDRKGSNMTPAIAAQARTVFGLSADIPDDKLDDAVAQKAIELAQKIKDQDKRIIALSADDPTSLTPSNLAAHEFNSAALWDLAAKKGVPAGTVKALKDLFRTGEKPNRIALSASAENGHPLEFNVARILANATMPIGLEMPTGRDATFPVAFDATANRLTDARIDELAKKAGYMRKTA